MKRVVFTGGPCSGKTTLLKALEQKGYATIPEVARMLLLQEQRKLEIRSWTRTLTFQHLVAMKQCALEEAQTATPLFLDRGLGDVIGYSFLYKIQLPQWILQRAKHRYQRIFLLDPLPYQKDAQRSETSQEAQAIHHALREAYHALGYLVERVPVLPLQERVAYALEQVL